MSTAHPDTYPGASLGLPESGRGSLATWGRRLAALILDWGLCMVVATGLFGPDVIRGHGWQQWMVLVVYVVHKAVLTALLGGSFGQLLAGVTIMGVDGSPIGWLRSVARAVMTGVVIPAVVVGADRRGLHDLLLGTVAVHRRD